MRCSKQDDSLILLQDEIELGKRYLDIEQVRLGERMRVNWHMPAAACHQSAAAVVAALLENAVYHGIAPSVEGGQIDIDLHEENNSGGWKFVTLRWPAARRVAIALLRPTLPRA